MSDCPVPEGEAGVRLKRAVSEMLAEHRRHVRARRLLAGAFATAALLLLVFGLGGEHTATRYDVGELRPAVAELGFEEGVDASVMVTIGVPLPKKPLPHWKAPPCTGRQREINNACWKKLAATPGDDMCGEDYEYDGSCWAPVAKRQKAPLTIQQEE